MTWDKLIKMEPLLDNLLKEIKKNRRYSHEKNWYGHEGWKMDMVYIVGGMRRYRTGDPKLFTSQAYDCAYKVLYEASNKK